MQKEWIVLQKEMMKTSDFSYDLPKELIAQTPVEPRDHSRLMVLHKESGEVEHRHFYDEIGRASCRERV